MIAIEFPSWFGDIRRLHVGVPQPQLFKYKYKYKHNHPAIGIYVEGKMLQDYEIIILSDFN